MVKKISLIFLSCFLIVFSVFSLNINFTNCDIVLAEEVDTVTDLTGYQWYANEVLSFPDGDSYNLSFSINGLWGISYDTLTSNFIVTDHSFGYLAFRGLRLYHPYSSYTFYYYGSANNSSSVIYAQDTWSGGYSNMAKRYFLFLGGTDSTNTYLINWLSANGTLSYVGTTNIIENVINNAILNPVVYRWNNVIDLSSLIDSLSFNNVFYFMRDNVLYSVNNFTVSSDSLSYTYTYNDSSTFQVYSTDLGWSDSSYQVIYFPTTYGSIESYVNDSTLYDFLLSNGSFSDYNSYSYDQGYNNGYSIGYNNAYNDGLAYATNMFSGYGPFLYSTWSIVNRFDHSQILGDFTGRFTSEYFNSFNGGFTFSNQLFADIESYFLENEDSEGVFKVVFDNYLPISQYTEWVTYNFTFGNEITFILDNGSKIYIDNDSVTKSINLSDYSNLSIVSLFVSFASSFSDYGDFGLSSNANYMYAYQNGYNDGFGVGKANGFSDGFKSGKASGYNEGLNAANQFTFFSLISAVVDAPINAFSSLFNFDILGVNILSLLTGLFTLLLVVVVIKLIMGGK